MEDLGSLKKEEEEEVLLLTHHGLGSHFLLSDMARDMIGHTEGESQPPLMGLSKKAEVNFSLCYLVKPRRFGSPTRGYRS